VACQAARRASRGWEDVGCALPSEEAVGGGLRERLVRRVSWRPGAEGAEGLLLFVLVVVWAAGGAIRRDCWMLKWISWG